jgi:hypothetical protein
MTRKDYGYWHITWYEPILTLFRRIAWVLKYGKR